jgi:hypothetical protein
MDQLGCGAGRATRKIVHFAKIDGEAAPGRVPCDSAAIDPATDNQNIIVGSLTALVQTILPGAMRYLFVSHLHLFKW